MKMLLDENIPFRLYQDFGEEHEVYSVNYMKWNSYTNGELLRRMLDEKFEALVTWDQNIAFQQNFQKYPITVFILRSPSNDYADLKPLVIKILDAVKDGVRSGPLLLMGNIASHTEHRLRLVNLRPINLNHRSISGPYASGVNRVCSFSRMLY